MLCTLTEHARPKTSCLGNGDLYLSFIMQRLILKRIMIITGLITLLTSILFWWVLYFVQIWVFWTILAPRFLFPDSPLAARFLTLEERVLAIQRIKVNQSGVENKHWKRDQWEFLDGRPTFRLICVRFIETLRDPKTWVMALFAAIAWVCCSLERLN